VHLLMCGPRRFQNSRCKDKNLILFIESKDQSTFQEANNFSTCEETGFF